MSVIIVELLLAFPTFPQNEKNQFTGELLKVKGTFVYFEKCLNKCALNSNMNTQKKWLNCRSRTQFKQHQCEPLTVVASRGDGVGKPIGIKVTYRSLILSEKYYSSDIKNQNYFYVFML